VARRAPPEQVAPLLAAARAGRGRAWVPYLAGCDAAARGAAFAKAAEAEGVGGGAASASAASAAGGAFEGGGALFIHPGSAVDEADAALAPQFVCFTEVVVAGRPGRRRAFMRGVTAVDGAWLHALAAGTPLSALGPPLASPAPRFDAQRDAVVCSRVPVFGDAAWRLAPVAVPLLEGVGGAGAGSVRSAGGGGGGGAEAAELREQAVRVFARALLEGGVARALRGEAVCGGAGGGGNGGASGNEASWLAAPPAQITQRTPQKRVAALVAALSAGAGAGSDAGPVCSGAALAAAWRARGARFLFAECGAWAAAARADDFARAWPRAVRELLARLPAAKVQGGPGTSPS